MGSGASTMTNNAMKQRNRRIDTMIKEDHRKTMRTAKLLLLGASESGKSTFVKQMRIVHQDGFSTLDRERFKHIIHCNVVESIESILAAMKKLDIVYEDKDRSADEDLVFKYSKAIQLGQIELSYEVAQSISRLWRDDGVRQCTLRSSQYKLLDSAQYFLDKVEQLAYDDYRPTDQDILHSRTATTGIVETFFEVQKIILNLVDVGGQKTERRKWIHCFEDCTSLIFLVALSCYDMNVWGDEKRNQMCDNLELFHSTCNNKWLQNISVILFLNKLDIFKKKVKYSPLSVCFPAYKGANTCRDAGLYIKGRFESLNEFPTERTVYTHFTVATNTENIQAVFNDVIYDILMRNLQSVA
ncbi:guanine nucleotide-binding protein G(i) subunit alpha-like, partial [Saccoglossus kowalevskii]